jgi:hypothetical protein
MTDPVTLSFSCVVRGHTDHWEAFCLDLDLAVQGRSYDYVHDQLRKAIEGYIEAALLEDEQTRDRLLNRRAPLRVRLYWAFRLFWATISGRSLNHDSITGFAVACPA